MMTALHRTAKLDVDLSLTSKHLALVSFLVYVKRHRLLVKMIIKLGIDLRLELEQTILDLELLIVT